jgi:hypothetical protein
MATTIKETEAIPESYPDRPWGLSDKAAALDSAFIWQRIESYIRLRFTERAVAWVVEGPGDWSPPLSPATVSATEVWNGGAWEAATLSPSPLGGYELPSCGPYRFTASVGGGPVTATASEAYKRLAEYFAATMASPGIRQNSTDGLETIEYDASATARAMERSGAGDLLRPYRRVS